MCHLGPPRSALARALEWSTDHQAQLGHRQQRFGPKKRLSFPPLGSSVSTPKVRFGRGAHFTTHHSSPANSPSNSEEQGWDFSSQDRAPYSTDRTCSRDLATIVSSVGPSCKVASAQVSCSEAQEPWRIETLKPSKNYRASCSMISNMKRRSGSNSMSGHSSVVPCGRSCAERCAE